MRNSVRRCSRQSQSVEPCSVLVETGCAPVRFEEKGKVTDEDPPERASSSRASADRCIHSWLLLQTGHQDASIAAILSFRHDGMLHWGSNIE